MTKKRILDGIARRLDRSLGKRLPDSYASRLLWVAAQPETEPAQTIRLARRLEVRDARREAVDLLARALAKNPWSSELAYELGFLRERDGELDAAVDAYSQSINIKPTPQALYRRGRCRQALGEHRDASADFSHSLRMDGTDARVHRALLQSNATEPLWRRMEILEGGLAANATDEDWLAQLASARYSMGNYGEAGVIYRTLADHEHSVKHTLRYIECLYLSGKRVEARQEYRSRSKSLAQNDQPAGGLGGLLQSLGMWADAAAEYERSLGNSPTPEAVHRCGFAYLRAYEFEKALPLLSRAARAPAAPPVWSFHEGMCLEKSNRWSAAIHAYLWAFMGSRSSYHLYRAVYCVTQVNDVRLSCLVSDHLRRKLIGHEVAGTQDEDDGLSPAEVERLSEARSRRAREVIRKAARQARLKGCVKQSIEALYWLCNTAEELEKGDFEDLAAALLQDGRIDEAFEAYLDSRPFRTAHGLEESKLPPGLDRRHAIYIEFSEHLPVDENKVLYESNHGSSVTCNVLPLLRENLTSPRGRSQEHVVVLNEPYEAPAWLSREENVHIVVRDSHAYLRHLATAGWLINNNTFPPYFSRRTGQKYLNTWHGTPLKTLGKDIRSGTMDHRNAARNLLHVTHLALPNMHTARVLMDRYDVSGLFQGKLSITGSPRMDNTIQIDRDRVRQLHGRHLDDRPVVLYAPTWRGTLSEQAYDTDRLVQDLQRLSELPITLVFKPHPLTAALLKDIELPVHPYPAGCDLNELLAVSDCLITDYSSVMFDFYPLDRPVLLYAYDEEEYLGERGAYFSLGELPGQVCRTIDQLVLELEDALSEGARLQPGTVDATEFCASEDGHATERVLQFLFEESSEGVVDSRFTRKRSREILFFAGSYIPNGITSSFDALARKLVASGEYNVSVVLQPEAVFSEPERLEKFLQLPEEVRAFGRVGSMAVTPEERWLVDRFNSRHTFFSAEHRDRVKQAFRREFRRLFGDVAFDDLVCFEGYARFWAAMIGSAGTNSTSTHIYLHNDMVLERDMRFKYLDAIFELYTWYDSLVSVSESVNDVNREKLTNRVHIEPAKMVSVRNMIDVPEIRCRASRGASLDLPWGSSESVKCFVATGRLTPQKGHDLLVEAFSNVAKEYDEARLVIVGDGPLGEELRSVVAARGLTDRVIFPGYMENPLGVVAQSDCFVFPSRYEGQGLSLVEGLVLGLPGIGTDVVGVRSVLADGEGMLVELSAAGLEKGLRAFLDGEDLGTRAFDAERYVEVAFREFEAALAMARRPHGS